MTEEPGQDRAGCSATSVQMPDTLHIDLPDVDPVEVHFSIIKCLVQVTREHWKLMRHGLVTGSIMCVVANGCMDIIQTFAEAILDVVVPQVYRYMRTYGTFSPTILGLTEERIHTYLGDSIEQALSKCLKINVQEYVATKQFSQWLWRHISEAVNSVLRLSTQCPIQESRLPVVFVSGCLISFGDLKHMVCHMLTILIRASQEMREALSRQSSTVEEPIVYSTNEFKKFMKAYIIRMVDVLRSRAQMPQCEMSSSSHRDICIRVGTNTQILSVEDSESPGQQSAMSSYSGLDAIPGAVPDSNDTASHSESCSFTSVTVIGTTKDHSHHLSEMESIGNIVNELVQTAKDVHTDSDGLVIFDNYEFRELTDRIFNMVMSGRDYQIPLVPDGTRMCDTVICRQLRRGDVTNQGIVTHALYMMTEEVVTRCLLWSALFYLEFLDISNKCAEGLPFVYPQEEEEEEEEDEDEEEDTEEEEEREEEEEEEEEEDVAGNLRPPSHYSSTSSQLSNITFDVVPKPLERTLPQMLEDTVLIYLLKLLAWEILIVIGIRSFELFSEIKKKMVSELQDVDLRVHNLFHTSLMVQNYKDICQNAINDLLLEFGSVQRVQEAARSRDPHFEDAIVRALRKQLGISTSPVPQGNTTEKTTCGFYKKFKNRLCRKKSLRKEEPLKEQTKKRCPLLRRIAASTRNMCSSSKRMFSSIARAFGRLCVSCFSPESQ